MRTPHTRGGAQPKELCPLLAANLTQMHDSTLAHTYMVQPTCHMQGERRSQHHSQKSWQWFLDQAVASNTHQSLLVHILGRTLESAGSLGRLANPSSNYVWGRSTRRHT